MRFKHVPEDFVVEELLGLGPQPRGPFALYRVQKRDVPTLVVQEKLAGQLGLPRSRVQFPALKDKNAVATQWAAVQVGGNCPRHLDGPGFTAELAGFLGRPLAPRDLQGNQFRLVLRDLSAQEVPALCRAFDLLAAQGWPNYFDLQRFGSWNPRLGFPGKLVLQGDCAGALRAYLAEPLVGDPPEVLRLKAMARERWGDWAALKSAAPRSNLRSVLAFLVDHPQDLRRALNLVTPRVLSLWLSAYQSFLWNRVSSGYLQEVLQGQDLAALPMPWGDVFVPQGVLPPDLLVKVENVGIPLLWHRVQIVDLGVRRLVEEVLGQEGFELQDLKARVLKRAFLSRGGRRLWVRAQEAQWPGDAQDEFFPGQRKVALALTLEPGSYATLFLRILALVAGIPVVQVPVCQVSAEEEGTE